MSAPADWRDGFALLTASCDVFPEGLAEVGLVDAGGLGVVVIPRAPLVALIVEGTLAAPLKGSS